MLAVRHQGHAPDRFPDPDLIDSDKLIADCANQGGRHPQSKVRSRSLAGPLLGRRIARKDSAGHDKEDDRHSGNVLGAGVPVGEPSICLTAGEGEGNPKRDRGEDIGQIVDSVSQQRRASPDHNNGDLQDKGH